MKTQRILPVRRSRTTRLAAAAVLGVLAVPALTGCIGNDGGDDTKKSSGGGDSECAPPDEAMDTAKSILDETSGVDLTLATDDSPSDIAIINADLTVVRPDSFKGTFTGQAFGQQAPGEAVGIGDDYWIKVEGFPGYTDWGKVDPKQFNIPAISTLLDPDKGISNVLVNSEGLGDGKPQRDENDESKVLCYYEGTLPADVLTSVIPSAAGDDFSIEYAVDDEGALRKATMTGDFYDNDELLTYVLDFVEYDVDEDIKAPK